MTTIPPVTAVLQSYEHRSGPSTCVLMRDRMTARAIRRSKARNHRRKAPQAPQTARKGFGA